MSESEQSASPKSGRISWLRSIAESLMVVLIVLFVLGLLFPAHPHGHGGPNRRSEARMLAMQLVTRIKLYETEYGRLPPFEPMLNSEAAQTQLIRVLQAKDLQSNPRRVPFLDESESLAVKRGSWGKRKYEAGVHPESGVYLDPWGRPFRILLDLDNDGRIKTPFTDIAEVRGRVAIWSLGKDGVQGSPGKENILKDSDDVVSWE